MHEVDTRKDSTTSRDRSLVSAKDANRQAMNIIICREQDHHRPLDLIDQERRVFTAYHFGYLYPLSDLRFWERGRTGVTTALRCHFHEYQKCPEDRGDSEYRLVTDSGSRNEAYTEQLQ